MDGVEFWDNVDRSAGPDGCWPWTRAIVARYDGRAGGGYGQVSFKGKLRGAHRLAYCLAHGLDIDAVPSSVVVRHTCDNPSCCNPAHMLTGTHGDNRKDAIERGRIGNTAPKNPERGEARKLSKWTDTTVAAARAEYDNGDSVETIADRYGMSRTGTWKALTGRTWSHVPDPCVMRSPSRLGRPGKKV